MERDEIVAWLLDGDVSIRYQVHRDLLGDDRATLQKRIAREGWGARYLAAQRADGHWGRGYYQPKWISTHYTMVDLKNLCLAPTNRRARRTLKVVLDQKRGIDGGVSPFGVGGRCDVCVNGMFLNFASYFGAPETRLHSVVDFLLDEHMSDGGFNCRSNGSGAVHGSLHTTISVAEGIREYIASGYHYRREELNDAEEQSQEFMLQHRLYKSDHTGKTIDKRFLMLSYPSRWRYDILRALEYFRCSTQPYDRRMQDAIDVLLAKRRACGRWPLQARHPGQTHFDMEKAGRPSRWNTLRAMRVLGYAGVTI